MDRHLSGGSYVKGEGIFECYHFGGNESGVLCIWRITDQMCSGQCGFSGIHELCESLRSTFKAMSFQSLHWLQKFGSCKASFGAKVV